ncbi:hypothetical protein GGX14DRAFT_677719 [Mycena pura]|uniref:Uncharacterized protein n=1 Tax=Mycena pura TaxID=153505 RepID=A0AAD6Y1P2_9AGAR|nr:hypothetical protein GGX14DRAFT_677719 [Mycena pura]
MLYLRLPQGLAMEAVVRAGSAPAPAVSVAERAAPPAVLPRARPYSMAWTEQPQPWPQMVQEQEMESAGETETTDQTEGLAAPAPAHSFPAGPSAAARVLWHGSLIVLRHSTDSSDAAVDGDKTSGVRCHRYGVHLPDLPGYSVPIVPIRCCTTRIPARGSSISSVFNWMCIFAVVQNDALAIANIPWRVFIIFAIFNVCWVPQWCRTPCTKVTRSRAPFDTAEENLAGVLTKGTSGAFLPSFLHNVVGIIGVAIGGVVLLVIGGTFIPAWDVLVDLPVGNLVDDVIVLLWDSYIVGNLVYSCVKEDAALDSGALDAVAGLGVLSQLVLGSSFSFVDETRHLNTGESGGWEWVVGCFGSKTE